ncbi:MAG: hypothetical protein HS117_04960 [Verrucomicrobiaceae bacterium]|jgi:hypothetical protein|nr:hypothetical protein [Verrucomicrobiaceae bacterium]
MKTLTLRSGGIAAAALLFAAAFFVSAPGLRAADDINTLYQQGRAAFHKGDFETAGTLLSQVAAAAPNHVDTQNMLRFIRANQKVAVSTLKKDYAAVVLPKLDLQEVTLTEAVDGLRMLSKNASNGKVTPNIIIKGADLGGKKLSLSLANIPLPEAIEYLAQLTGSKATYEKHAVVLSPVAQPQTASKDK